jgi:hypothetical protein
MRALMSIVAVVAVVAWPGAASARPAPQDGPRLAGWQVDGSPLFFDGDYYCRAGATVYFDPKLMVVSGEFEGVPVIVDTTIEPNSIVYAPIGGSLLQPYERPRNGDKAGTTGSRTPSFPVSLSAERDRVRQPSDALEACGRPLPRVEYPNLVRAVEPENRAPVDEEIRGEPPVSRGPRGSVRSAALPTSNDGIWIEFEGARWAVSGNSSALDLSRFTEVGRYRGSPVYRLRDGNASWELFVRPSPRSQLTRFIRIDR